MTDIKNGATVHRCWPDTSGELIAHFQYMNDAVEFCQALRDKGNAMYIAVCHYSGDLRIFTDEPTDGEGDA